MPTPYPCLWFDGRAEEAATFYASLLPDSHVDRVWRSPADTPSGPAGMVLTVDFTLGGRRFQALNGGADFRFTEAVSFVIECEDQAEVDHPGTRSPPMAVSPAHAAGSRTASGSPGRSCRVASASSWAILTGAGRAASWRRCWRWARIEVAGVLEQRSRGGILGFDPASGRAVERDGERRCGQSGR